MRIIVQKFGGTSVSTSKRREMVADRVIEAIEKGFSPVVVVSAIGRKGDPYATDTLLSLISERDSLNRRELDLLMCCGEIISSVVLSDVFAARGYEARVLTGGRAGILTDENYGNADILEVKTDEILKILEEGVIPIVTGFQGISRDGDFTTLGRGGSDVTGAVLGAALNAECVEIYTDVDGVMTADPNIVKNARIIDEISYNEVFKLAQEGAKVIHPRAVEYAMKGNVPLIIKNTLSDAKGTIISNCISGRDNVITGITCVNKISQVTIDCEDDEILGILSKNNISIDFINIFPEKKVFTINESDERLVREIFDEFGLKYNIIGGCSKVAVVGNRMRGIPGIMAKILKILRDENIKVLQTADSHTTIWCLVKEEDAKKAVNALHGIFCGEGEENHKDKLRDSSVLFAI